MILSTVSAQDSTRVLQRPDSLSAAIPIDSLFASAADSVQSSPDSLESTTQRVSPPEPFVPMERRDTTGWHLSAQEAQGTIAEDVMDFLGLYPMVGGKDYGSLGQFGRLYTHASLPVTAVDLNGLLISDPIYGALNPGLIPINDFRTMASEGAPIQFGHLTSDAGLVVKSYLHDDPRPFSKLTYRTGDWGYSDMGAILGIRVSRQGVLTVSGNHQELDGFALNQNHKGNRVFLNLRLQPRPRVQTEISSFFNKHKTQLPSPMVPAGLPWVARLTHKEVRSDHHLIVRVGRFPVRNAQLNVRLFASYLRHETSADSNRFNPINTTYGVEVEELIQKGSHTLAIGANVKTDRLRSPRLGDHDQALARFYLNHEAGLSGRLTLNGQVAAEQRSGQKMRLLPMARLIYVGEETAAWVLWQRKIRYPGFAERYWPTVHFSGFEDLRAETSDVTEFGLRTILPGRVQVTGSVFAVKTQDLIGNLARDEGSAFGPANLGNRAVAGSALTLTTEVKGIRFGTAGTVVFSPESPDDFSSGIPQYQVHSFMESGRHLFERFVFARLRLIHRVFGPREDVFYTGAENVLPVKAELQPDGVLDAKLTLEFTSATVFVAIENMLSREYQLQPGFFMPITTWRGGIEWEFWD